MVEMNSFFVLCFCFGFLATIIHGTDNDGGDGSGNECEDGDIETLEEKLDRMAENGESINNILQLTPEGYLGEGTYGLAYAGFRISDLRPAAVKFIQGDNKVHADREYSMYTYLDAIDNANVERFGIPAIYYYGRWDAWVDYIVMALSLFEQSLQSKADDNEFEKPLNNLIVFRQFVRQSKYLHSRGVRHDDIKADNMMIRSYQCFLIDFNLSSGMKNDTKLGTFIYKPRRCHRKHPRLAIDDWESFFYAMCYINIVKLKWLFTDEYDNLHQKEKQRKVGGAKKDIKDIRRKVKAIKPKPLRDVFMAFYNEIFGDRAKKFPDYDGMDHIITAHIDKLVAPNQTVFFTWMDENDTEAALKHMKEYPIPNIHKDIKEPSKIDFDTFTYPKVDFEYFYKTAAGVLSLSQCGPSSNISSLNTELEQLKLK